MLAHAANPSIHRGDITNRVGDQPEMSRETPLTDAAATGLASGIENAPAVTVIEVTLAVPRAVVPLRSETDAALALHVALTPVKFTAVTSYACAVALYDVV